MKKKILFILLIAGFLAKGQVNIDISDLPKNGVQAFSQKNVLHVI
jgi:hypothetical protein